MEHRVFSQDGLYACVHMRGGQTLYPVLTHKTENGGSQTFVLK